MKVKKPITEQVEVEMNGTYKTTNQNFYYFGKDYVIEIFNGDTFKDISRMNEERFSSYSTFIICSEAEFMKAYDEVISDIESRIADLHSGLHFQIITTGETDFTQI